MIIVLKEQKLAGLSPEWVFPATTDRCHTKGERYAFFPKYTWARLRAKATELRRAPVTKELMDGGATAEEAAEQAAMQVPEIKGGPHKTRHTYASHFLAAKPDLFLLGRVLGHSHSRVTELYSHLLPDHLAEARGVVSFVSAMGPVETPPVRDKTKTGRALPRSTRLFSLQSCRRDWG